LVFLPDVTVSDPTTINDFMNIDGSTTGSCWEPQSKDIKMPTLTKWKTVRKNGPYEDEDLRLYDCGKILTCVDGCPTSSGTVGEVFIEYVVQFRYPTPAILGSTAYLKNGAGTTKNAIFGTTPAWIVDANGRDPIEYVEYVTNKGRIHLLPGNYFVFTEIVGTTLASIGITYGSSVTVTVISGGMLNAAVTNYMVALKVIVNTPEINDGVDPNAWLQYDCTGCATVTESKTYLSLNNLSQAGLVSPAPMKPLTKAYRTLWAGKAAKINPDIEETLKMFDEEIEKEIESEEEESLNARPVVGSARADSTVLSAGRRPLVRA